MLVASHEENTRLIGLVAKELRKRDEAAKYEGSLIEFVEYTWRVIEPARPFVRGWALDAIAEHLEAVTRGELTRLLINVPPGFSKSLLTDVFWPAWEWGPKNMPWLRYVCASYAAHLTIRDNIRFRHIIKNDRYRKFWGDRFDISDEQATKIKLANTEMGWKFATSVGGVTGGERGDRFIIDDPNNPQDTESDPVRSSTNHWFLEVVPDRLNDIGKSAIIIIQQRLHEEDVSGVAMANGLGYTHLMIPMEYEPSRHCVTSIGWQDPRGCDDEWNELPDEEKDQRVDELAWPERFPPASIQTLKMKGPYAWAGQYQQSPEPRGGGIFRRDWWMPWEGKKNPPCEYVVASLDTAYTEKEENDPSALSVWGLWRDGMGNPKIILIDCWAKRLAIHGPDVPRTIGENDRDYIFRSQHQWGLVEWVDYSCRLHKVDRLLIESSAAGISVAQEIRRLYVGAMSEFGVELVTPKGDKIARAYAVQHLLSEGMVYCPFINGLPTDVVGKLVDEAAVFPKASHDDLTDTMSQALHHLRSGGMAQRRVEAQYEREESMKFRSKPQPLYPC